MVNIKENKLIKFLNVLELLKNTDPWLVLLLQLFMSCLSGLSMRVVFTADT